MSTPRSFSRSVSVLITGQVLISVIAIATAVVMARALGTEGRGQFSLALLLPTMLSTFTDFGIGTSGPRFAASKSWPPATILASQLVAGAVRILIVGAIGICIIVFARNFVFPGVPAKSLSIGLFQLVPLTIAGFVLPLLLGVGRASTYGRLLVLSPAVSFGALCAIWLFLDLTVDNALIIEIVSGTGAGIVIWKTVSLTIGKLDRPRVAYLAEAYRFGLGVYASNVTLFANTRLILLLINYFAGPASVGLYTIAQTASERVYLLADAMGTLLLPRVAEDPDASSANLTPSVFRAAIVGGTCLALILAFLSDWIVNILFSPEFASAAPILRLLLVAVVLTSGWRVLFQDLNARGHSVLTALINGMAGIVTIGLSIILLPVVGLKGAAWATIVAASLSLLCGIFLYCRLSVREKGLSLLFVPTMHEWQAMLRAFRKG